MCLPSSRFANLRDGRALGTLEHGDHLRLLAAAVVVCAGAWRSRFDDRVDRLDADWRLAGNAERVVTLGRDKPVRLVCSDKGAIDESCKDLAARTAFDVVREPDDLAFCVLMRVGQDGVLRGCELDGHLKLLWVVDGVRMNASFRPEAKHCLRIRCFSLEQVLHAP